MDREGRVISDSKLKLSVMILGYIAFIMAIMRFI
jgi:hypothetical protein